MNHIMLDLETMSLEPNAALVSIGAVAMNDRAEPLPSGFYANVSLASSVNAGLHIDPGTVMWWLGQSDSARAALTGETQTLHAALADFRDWVFSVSAPGLGGVWGNGAAADNVWIASAFKASHGKHIWSHKLDRCYRTFRAMHSDMPEPPANDAAHNALADAKWQAEHMRLICAQKGLVLS